MSDKFKAPWLDTDLFDMRGDRFVIGDRVVRAKVSGRAANIEVVTVTRIENGKMYLDNSKVAIHYPSRLLIVSALHI